MFKVYCSKRAAGCILPPFLLPATIPTKREAVIEKAVGMTNGKITAKAILT
ncbi:MAG: hypothetical protein ACQKBV_04825 [Puniceicoccales bacterium]